MNKYGKSGSSLALTGRNSLWLRLKIDLEGKTQMKDQLMKLYLKLQLLLENEEGQDLVEYSLVVALIAFAAVTGMGSLANSINAGFTQIGVTLTTAVG
jgi:pilus assembly protein Flp/PilA